MGLDRFVLLYVIILVVAILLDAGLILAWRHLRQRRDWPGGGPRSPAHAPESAPPAASLPPSLRRLSTWAAAHWRELAVGLLLLVLLGYIRAVTPRTVIPPFATGPVERPPLAGLGRIWRFLDERTSTWVKLWPTVSTIALVGLYLGGWRSGRRRQALRAGTLLALLAMAMEGQLLLLDGKSALASAFYGLALLGCIVWLALCRPAPQEEPLPTRRMSWVEAGLLVLVLALTTCARFYALPRIPYGIEGDESKWTIEVVSVMLDGQHTIQSEYHYATEPASFYMQVPFHHLLGPGILSARIAVATYSVLATLAFYWLVRETLGPPAALLATALLAISLVDISASRLALAEAHVKFWAVAGLAFLAHGLRVLRPVHSFLGGLALAIGLLTYDTFAPMIAVAVVWVIIALAAQRASLREWVAHLTALLAPILVVAPFVAEYLLGRMQYYDSGSLDWNTAPLSVFLTNSYKVIQNFWQQTYGDFLFVRSGPIVNGLLVPFLALGFVLALARIRRPGYALPALWFALLFFPVPVYAGAPYVRVFYPGFPALYILVALVIILAWRETAAALPAHFRPALVALACLVSVGLILLNFYLYFNEVKDPDGRQLRRELADTVTQAVAPGRRVYVPYFAESSDAIQFEQPLFLLEVRRKLSRDQIAQHIWVGTYEEFLFTLSREGIYFENLAFVINHSLQKREEDLAPILETLQRCLGAHLEREGRWFDLYLVDTFDIQAARCAAPQVHLGNLSSSTPEPGQPVQLHWWMEDASGPAQALLKCQRLRSNTVVVEAEDMQRDDGWEEDWRFVTGFRGRGYLADRMVLGSAYITVTLPSSGTHALWIRTYRRMPDPYPFHLSVDGQTHTLAYAPGDPLSEWAWVQVASLPLGAGTHTVRMARPIQEWTPGTLALFVDALILSNDLAFDPEEDSEWLPFFELHEEVLPYVSSGTFRYDGVAPGNYRCWVTLLDGERLVDLNGEVGARSNVVEFTVKTPEDFRSLRRLRKSE